MSRLMSREASKDQTTDKVETERTNYFSELERLFGEIDEPLIHTQRPINRVRKMTLKNQFPNNFMFKKNRLHASCDNNLPGALKNEIQQFQSKVEERGYILRRIPTIDILPPDKQKILKERKYRKQVFDSVANHFDTVIANEDMINNYSRTMMNIEHIGTDPKYHTKLKVSGSPLTRRGT